MNPTGRGGAEDDDGLKTETVGDMGELGFVVQACYPAHLLEYCVLQYFPRVSPFGHISGEPVLVSNRQAQRGGKQSPVLGGESTINSPKSYKFLPKIPCDKEVGRRHRKSIRG